MEATEDESFHEEKESLPPQKNNLFNYFAKKVANQPQGKVLKVDGLKKNSKTVENET